MMTLTHKCQRTLVFDDRKNVPKCVTPTLRARTRNTARRNIMSEPCSSPTCLNAVGWNFVPNPRQCRKPDVIGSAGCLSSHCSTSYRPRYHPPLRRGPLTYRATCTSEIDNRASSLNARQITPASRETPAPTTNRGHVTSPTFILFRCQTVARPLLAPTTFRWKSLLDRIYVRRVLFVWCRLDPKANMVLTPSTRKAARLWRPLAFGQRRKMTRTKNRPPHRLGTTVSEKCRPSSSHVNQCHRCLIPSTRWQRYPRR